MNFIEKHSKILAIALCACACGPVLSTAYAYENQPGWHGEGADRYYVLESNRKEATGLTEIDGDLYYFNGKGEMQFGWQNVPNGIYYFQQDGTAATGETVIQGTSYNFQEEGQLLHGWDEEFVSYYDEKGYPVSQSWVDDGGFKYYFDENGKFTTGWKEINGEKYYFAEDGKMSTGEVSVDGTTYYLQADGTYVTGWKQVGENKYYHDENGKTLTDCSEVIDGKTYFFDETGKMITSSQKDGYTISSDGSATKNESSNQVADSTTKAPANGSQSSNTGSQSSNSGSQGSTGKPSTPNVPSVPSVPAAPSINNSAIANAALAQVGVSQDCTMLVTNSLRAVGINFHGWPEEYLSLGTLTSTPVPGDICVYSGHVAIYIGNGQAVHGGWDGYTTVVTSVSCSNAFIGYVHIG
ncbi:MAG: NlpC/P60 family protein [Floccifex sp.]